MTAYFDDTDRAIRQAEVLNEWPVPEYHAIEQRLVFDCTVASQMTGFPPEARDEINRAVLRYGVRMLPANVPEPDFDTLSDYRDRLLKLSFDLHTAFHDVARGGHGSDSPLHWLDTLYFLGDQQREQIAQEEG